MTEKVLLFLLLFLGSGFFSSSETAFFSLTSIEKKRISKQKDLLSRLITQIVQNPSKTLVSILVGNMLINTAMSTAITMEVNRKFGVEWLGLVLGIFTFVLLIFGEILPKKVALNRRLFLVHVFCVPLTVFSYLIVPFRNLLLWIAEVLGGKVEEEVEDVDFSDYEVRQLVELGKKHGVVDESESLPLSNIISFGERTVREIMVPRTDVIAFDLDEGHAALNDLIMKQMVHNVVVYKDSIDQVVGTISSREFLLHSDKSMKQLLKPPIYIPELKRIDELIFKMRREKFELAICVDEYGGVAGVISHDEVIEAVFGELHEEEHENEEEDRIMLKGDGYVVDAGISLYDFNQELQLEKPLESDVIDSLNGYLIDLFDEIPEEGYALCHKDLEFRVLKAEKNRILQIEVIKIGERE